MSGEVEDKEFDQNFTASNRFILYTKVKQAGDELTINLQSILTSQCNLHYLRFIATGGHVMVLNCVDRNVLNNSLQKIKQMPLTRVLETDSIQKIQ